MNSYLIRPLAIFALLSLAACSDNPSASEVATIEATQTSTVVSDDASATIDDAPVELVEIKLIDAQDEARGYCVDLFDHLTRAQPIAGLQAHDCFLYMGDGPKQDQGFDLTLFNKTGQLRLAHFDICMEVHNPQASSPGSFVATEACTGSPVQTFKINDQGAISPQANEELCLTIGDTTVPGGPRVVPPGIDMVFPPENNNNMAAIRRLTFETCSLEIAKRQQWEFRSGDYVPDNSAVSNRFIYDN